MRATRYPAPTELADLCFTAEQLYSDLLNVGLLVAAASQSEVLEDLRRRVREEHEGE